VIEWIQETGNLGAWWDNEANVRSAQAGLNVLLIQEGMRPILEDGEIGSRTCGANAWIKKRLGSEFFPAAACSGKSLIDPLPSGGAPGVENFYKNARDAAIAEMNAAGVAAGDACSARDAAVAAGTAAAAQFALEIAEPAAGEAKDAADRADRAVVVTPPTKESDKAALATGQSHAKQARAFSISAMECVEEIRTLVPQRPVSCPAGQERDLVTGLCRSIECPAGQQLDPVLKKCVDVVVTAGTKKAGIGVFVLGAAALGAIAFAISRKGVPIPGA